MTGISQRFVELGGALWSPIIGTVDVVMPAAPCFLLKTPKTQCLVWRGPLSCGRSPSPHTQQQKNPARREARRIF
jgi:hypothetical protein